MLNNLISAGLISSALFIGTASAAERAFNFTSITHPGATVTEAQGISPKGDIVGLYVDKSGAVHGYVLSQGVFTTVDYPGAALTYLTGVNPEGDVVGVYSMPDEIPGLVFGRGPVSAPVNIHGFVLKHDGTLISLPPYPGHPNMIAQRILPDGSVLGCFHDHDFGFWMRGFVLRDGDYTGLDGTIDGLDLASSMNNGATPDLGQITGFYMDMMSNTRRSYVIQNGSLNIFDYPSASVVSTRAWDMNPSGAIVGDYRDATGVHGFLLESGSFASLAFPGATVTEPRGINPGGAIVGWYTDAKGSTHGFLAIPMPRHGQ
jgi:hypothetical protein